MTDAELAARLVAEHPSAAEPVEHLTIRPGARVLLTKDQKAAAVIYIYEFETAMKADLVETR